MLRRTLVRLLQHDRLILVYLGEVPADSRSVAFIRGCFGAVQEILYPTLARLLPTSAKALMIIDAVFRGLKAHFPELKFGASTGSMDTIS